MKKLFAVLVALTLVLSMGTIAFAAGTGTITISNALEDATYNIYKMFDFTPVAGSETNGRYTVVAEWADFLNGEGAAYLKANAETGTIEWNGEETDARKAELAKAAIAYAKAKSIAATATKTVTADGEVKFEGVDLGYYAIDTSLGTVCGLTNVNNEFVAHEKNAKPEIDKEVQEDADNSWGKVNDADIDQQVNYKATISVGKGVTNYVMHDTMSKGLTFNDDVAVSVDGVTVDEANYTVTSTGLTDGCTFEVAFDNDYIATLEAGKVIVVTYSATLNDDAVVAEGGNSNKVYLSYGEDTTWNTTEKETKTFTWKMDVFKFTVDGSKVPLEGAKFQLLDKDDNAIKFTDVTAEGGVPTYKVDEDGTVDTITTDANGKFELVGLDEGAYKLHETEAPAGYNKLATDVDVVITSTHTDADLTATYEINGDVPATIEVENKTGGLLPETGGIGTTIFYVVGGLLMVAALVLLVSKKRMASFA